MKQLLLILFACSACSAQSVGVHPLMGTQIDWSQNINKGIIGYWPMNEGCGSRVSDLSGNQLNGTIVNGTWGAGRLGFCLNSSGTGYVTTPSSSLLLPAAWTVSAWIKANDATYNTLFGWDVGNNYYGMQLHFASTGKPLLYMGSSNNRYFVAGAWTVLKNGSWHHVVVTIPGSAQNDISSSVMYLDGVSVAVDSTTATGSQSAKVSFGIGKAYAGVLNGSISDVCLWNRVLSASEIAQLYSNPFAGFVQDRPELYVTAAAPPAGGAAQVIIIAKASIGGVLVFSLLWRLARTVTTKRKAHKENSL